MMSEVEKQILTNQLCILATLGTIGKNLLHPIQHENIQKRIQETIKVRDKNVESNKLS